MYTEKIDPIDIEMLRILQENGRTKRSELAESVKLTIPAVSERLRKLEEHGVIRNYATVVDARKIHLEVTAFIFVMAESSTYFSKIIENAKKYDEILECHAITGGGSHLLKVRTQSTASLEKLLSKIQAWKGVKNTMTNIVLSSPKETTVLPVGHLEGVKK
jgi:Lrp/AsnC family leucine-responsive transcriptional regulator